MSILALETTQPPVQWVPGLSWGQIGQDVVLTTHPLLAPRLRECRAIHLPPLLGFQVCYGVLLPYSLNTATEYRLSVVTLGCYDQPHGLVVRVSDYQS
jgi:hypothetical protein